METIKIEIFNDKSYIRFYHYENLKEENERLKQQIEKMKCCFNCKNWYWKHSRCKKKLKGDCFKASKWELAE